MSGYIWKHSEWILSVFRQFDEGFDELSIFTPSFVSPTALLHCFCFWSECRLHPRLAHCRTRNEQCVADLF